MNLLTSKRFLPYFEWFFFSFLFLRFIPFPSGAYPGLDPSWQYALSYFHKADAVYGQDVIFTYGPLGHLLSGAALEHNFWLIFGSRILIHLLFVVLAWLISRRIEPFLLKSYFLASLLTAYWSGGVLFPEKQVLFSFLFLLLLLNRKIYKSNFSSLVLGLLAGFCLVSKFNIGFSSAISILLLVFFEVLISLMRKDGLNMQKVANFTFRFYLTLLSVAVVFLSPNSEVYTAMNIGALITGTSFIQVAGKKILKRSFDAKSNKILLLDLGSIFVYLSGLFYISSHHKVVIIDYLNTAWQMSSGYSSAMSIVGPKIELSFALFQVIVFIFIFVSLTLPSCSRLPSDRLPLSVVLLFIGFMEFKHGFVRQDSHVLHFFSAYPILLVLLIHQLDYDYWIPRLRVRVTTLLAALGITSSQIFLIPYYPSLSYKSTVGASISNVARILEIKDRPGAFRESVLYFSRNALKPLQFPPDLHELLAGKSVDVMPWEISLVKANHLQWSNRPVFQSYAAFTSQLDRANAVSYQIYPRDYVIYQFLSIDGRHQFFDEPLTFYSLYCNYKLSIDEDDTLKVVSPDMFLLSQRKKTICLRDSQISQVQSLNWGESIQIRSIDDSIVRANVKVNYSLLGKLYKFVFRAPPVEVEVRYSSGEQPAAYRFIPENADNGLLLSHLPRDLREIELFWKGFLPAEVESVRFKNENPWLYKRAFEIALITERLRDSRDSSHLSLTEGKVKFSSEAKHIQGYMDIVQGEEATFVRDSIVSFQGWAGNKMAPGTKQLILLTYGERNTPIAIGITGRDRKDVAEFLKEPKYAEVGWRVDVPLERLALGQHTIKAWVFDESLGKAFPLKNFQTVLIE